MKFQKILKISLGWRDWAVFDYNTLFENIFIVFYIALIAQNYTTGFIIHLLLFSLFSILSTSYGYLINDLSDRELDERQGKKNVFHGTSSFIAHFIVVLIFALSTVCALPFLYQSNFLVLWLVWLFITTFYSLKPIRFKERGYWNILIVVMAQRILPILLVFSAFQYWSLPNILMILVYVMLRGISSDIGHQLENYPLDKDTKIKTFSVQIGLQKTNRIFYVNLEIEKIFFLVLMAVMFYQLQNIYIYYTPIFYIFLLFYLLAYMFSIAFHLKGYDPNPFHPQHKNIFQFLHHVSPSVIFPILLCILLIKFNIFYSIIVILFVLSKRLYKKSVLQNSYPVKLFMHLRSRQRV